jgi:hypothetical protein
LKADKNTFWMSIYMLNKFRTKPDIFAPKVGHVAAKNEKHFLLSFDFEGPYRRSSGQQGVLCCNFFLVWVLIIE